jgi:hypothetical protein
MNANFAINSGLDSVRLQEDCVHCRFQRRVSGKKQSDGIRVLMTHRADLIMDLCDLRRITCRVPQPRSIPGPWGVYGE